MNCAAVATCAVAMPSSSTYPRPPWGGRERNCQGAGACLGLASSEASWPRTSAITIATAEQAATAASPQAKLPVVVLDPAHREGAEIAREIADRIDRRDARRGRRAGEDRRRQRPEHRQRGEDAERAERQSDHLEQGIVEERRTRRRRSRRSPAGWRDGSVRSMWASERRPHQIMPTKPTT